MKITNNLDKVNSVNTIDEDIQSMLLPLNLVMFCPKYSIKGNLIAPNSYINNCVSTLTTLVSVSAMCYRTYELSFYQEGINATIYYYSIYDAFYYSIGFIMNYIVSIYQYEKNVSLVLILQRVHRILNDATAFRQFIVVNWIFVITSLVTQLFLVSYACMLLSYFSKVNLVGFLLILFDFYIIYSMRLMKLMEDKVELWKRKLETSEEVDVHSFCKVMFENYIDILKCYKMIEDRFQLFMLFYVVEIFFNSLLYFQQTITILKAMKNIDAIGPAVLGIGSWSIRNIIFQTLLTRQCEKFYISIEKVQDSCAKILKSDCSDDERKLCKNVLRLHRASFNKIRACGLFYVDAALQLTLMSLLTNYTIVLLQFALL